MRWRALLAAMAAFGLCGASEAPHKPSDNAEVEASQAQSKSSAPATAPVTLGKVEQAPFSKKGDDEQGDPSRQLQEYGVYATVIQAAIGLLGLAGLFFTVLYAKRAWKAADASASAAIDTLKATQAGERRQLRAYVGVTSGILRNLDGKKPVEVEIMFRNAGSTPARNVNVAGGMLITAYPDGPRTFADFDQFAYRPTMLLPGAESRKTEKGGVPIDRIARLKAGDDILIVYGRITYEDVFGCKWVTHYRLFCGGGHPNWLSEKDGVEFGRLSPAEEGNEAT